LLQVNHQSLLNNLMLCLLQEWPPELEAALHGSRLLTADLVSTHAVLLGSGACWHCGQTMHLMQAATAAVLE
jgi:hypothetical protein